MCMPWFQPWAKVQVSTHVSVFIPIDESRGFQMDVLQ
jgi:hypothetical protein